MLSCQECERYLPVFLDQALEAKASLDIQAHLQSCSPCVERLAHEQHLRTLVRQSLQLPEPPEDLKCAMIRRAMQTDSPARWRTYLETPFRWRDFFLGAVAAALVAIAAPGLWDLSIDRDVQKVVREASLAYGTYTSQHMPLEVVSADDSAITQWLNPRMGYPIKIPCITDTSTQLLGGRMCRILDRKSVALIYQRHGVPIVLFAFRGDHMSLPADPETLPHKQGTIQVRYVSGRPVAMWQRDGVVYSMVGDVHRDDLMQVARTVSYR
jgi:anti-sigma factor RsiW